MNTKPAIRIACLSLGMLTALRSAALAQTAQAPSAPAIPTQPKAATPLGKIEQLVSEAKPLLAAALARERAMPPSQESNLVCRTLQILNSRIAAGKADSSLSQPLTDLLEDLEMTGHRAQYRELYEILGHLQGAILNTPQLQANRMLSMMTS